MDDALPDALNRRNVLYGSASAAADLKRHGDLYWAADRLLDALEFYARAGDAAGVEQVKRRAIEDGDAFLADRIAQLGQPALDAAQWRALAERAATRGMLVFARRAYERAGLHEAAAGVGGVGSPGGVSATSR